METRSVCFYSLYNGLGFWTVFRNCSQSSCFSSDVLFKDLLFSVPFVFSDFRKCLNRCWRVLIRNKACWLSDCGLGCFFLHFVGSLFGYILKIALTCTVLLRNAVAVQSSLWQDVMQTYITEWGGLLSSQSSHRVWKVGKTIDLNNYIFKT